MKLIVTAEDIEIGEECRDDDLGTADNCPFAQSLSRLTGDNYRIHAGFLQFEIQGHVLCNPTEAMIRFMEEFDKGAKVEPAEFDIEVLPTFPTELLPA